MTGMLTREVENSGSELVRRVARRAAKDSPRLADLLAEDLDKLAKIVVAESLRDEMRRAVDLERIDYQKERERFLERSSRTGSKHTQRAYRAALERLEAWCTRHRISPLELNPASADDWIEGEKAEGRASSSVRLSVSGVSAFWTWMERRHVEIRNPFRGTRARPANTPKRELSIPSPDEIAYIMSEAEPVLRAAIMVMARTGLRVGALPTLAIRGDRYTATTKGKDQTGTMPGDVKREIERMGLSLRAPFANLSAGNLADRFFYLVKKLHASGKLRARFSVHDLRHAFAVKIYQESHDVYAVRVALGHSNVSVTEKYLRSIECIER